MPYVTTSISSALFKFNWNFIDLDIKDQSFESKLSLVYLLKASIHYKKYKHLIRYCHTKELEENLNTRSIENQEVSTNVYIWGDQ